MALRAWWLSEERAGACVHKAASCTAGKQGLWAGKPWPVILGGLESWEEPISGTVGSGYFPVSQRGRTAGKGQCGFEDLWEQ